MIGSNTERQVQTHSTTSGAVHVNQSSDQRPRCNRMRRSCKELRSQRSRNPILVFESLQSKQSSKEPAAMPGGRSRRGKSNNSGGNKQSKSHRRRSNSFSVKAGLFVEGGFLSDWQLDSPSPSHNPGTHFLFYFLIMLYACPQLRSASCLFGC